MKNSFRHVGGCIFGVNFFAYGGMKGLLETNLQDILSTGAQTGNLKLRFRV